MLNENVEAKRHEPVFKSDKDPLRRESQAGLSGRKCVNVFDRQESFCIGHPEDQMKPLILCLGIHSNLIKAL